MRRERQRSNSKLSDVALSSSKRFVQPSCRFLSRLHRWHRQPCIPTRREPAVHTQRFWEVCLLREEIGLGGPCRRGGPSQADSRRARLFSGRQPAASIPIRIRG